MLFLTGVSFTRTKLLIVLECRITNSFWSDVQLKILHNNINITEKDVYFGIMGSLLYKVCLMVHRPYASRDS